MGISLQEARALGIPEEYLAEPERPRAFTGPAPGRRSKYRNVITEYNGVRYQSKSEANRARVLDLDTMGGLVSWWVRQVKFRLGVAENAYVTDFVVVMADGSIHAEDVKGASTPKWERDMKLWSRFGPCPLWVVRRGRVDEIITPNPGNGDAS